MCENSETLCVCPLGGILTTISKKWALLIINKLGTAGRLRFNDLHAELEGISPKTLSDTLKELQTERLVARESFSEIPPRVEYSLTEEGLQLREAIAPLLIWASRRDGLKRVDCEVSCRRRSCTPGGRACTRRRGT
ncbi:MAG: helix-turn-helix domain-containing protein [Methanomicrobiales archaeon]|nr:helix-turn-helix domain-containing protein [Methanomicrobiales archaeon]MDI6875760.1 helix-turn-helix domain-containing protein [Methanomicrobiales archaeon]